MTLDDQFYLKAIVRLLNGHAHRQRINLAGQCHERVPFPKQVSPLEESHCGCPWSRVTVGSSIRGVVIRGPADRSSSVGW